MKKTQLILNAILLQRARLDSIEVTDHASEIVESERMVRLYLYLVRHLVENK